MKIINHILESWGKSRREIPKNNDKMKMEVLSKIPANFIETPYLKHVRLPWLSFAFTAVALFVFLIGSGTTRIGENTTMSNVGIGVAPAEENQLVGAIRDEAESMNKRISTPSYYYPPQYETPISDDREFLKINYNSTLRTRHVSNLETKVETIVRGFGGRVDSVSNTDQYGHVSFAIPKEKFEAFKTEIKELVGSRFYVEQINSQNLLPQKQMIEENQKQIEKNLGDLKIERAQIVRDHNQTIAGYQTRINTINTEVSTLNTEYQTAPPIRQTEITSRINQLRIEVGSIESQVISENRSYQNKISNIDSRIKYTQENLDGVNAQDENLIDNVATVTGTITLRWINMWDLTDEYFPGPLLAWIFLGLAIIAFTWYQYSKTASYDYF